MTQHFHMVLKLSLSTASNTSHTTIGFMKKMLSFTGEEPPNILEIKDASLNYLMESTQLILFKVKWLTATF